ncbi:MAG TPA: gluconokinase [Burkholderiales bacterium]|nr:gluconokinase [Burkholderiales bacterium]
MNVILMGVSGVGKTTIGRILSGRLGWPLLDADEFHSAASIEKMRNGISLEDADRWPWLDRMNAALREREVRDESVLLACSALKRAYRERISTGIAEIRWIYLKGKFELIRERLEARKGHYMKAGLLESQFAALEEPGNALSVDIDDTPEAISDAILRGLQVSPARKTGSDK